MPPDRNVVVGVSAVVEHEGRRLMVRRGGSEWYADGNGTWAHPGGWMEFGETEGFVAVREVQEETGVVSVSRDVFGTYCNPNASGTLWIVNLFVRCDYLSGVPQVMEPEKCPEVAWVPVEKISQLPLFEPTRIFHQMLIAA